MAIEVTAIRTRGLGTFALHGVRNCRLMQVAANPAPPRVTTHPSSMTDSQKSPYASLPMRAFWKSAVAQRAPLDPGDLYHPKFRITREDRIVTAGSCFAQHVGRTLRTAEFNVLDAEPLPAGVPDKLANTLGYRLFSARYGNIYTVRQLLQLTREASGEVSPELPVWEGDKRFFDAQRPNIEPRGFETADEVLKHRRHHLDRVNTVFGEADLFVFTFGLTETWRHRASGTVYPTAPGTIAGEYDPDVFEFHNFDTEEVLKDFEKFRSLLMVRNPKMSFLITVSPVPLTATASGHHVEVATSYSKAVLRAVCGKLSDTHDNVDYFPSYEVITSQNARGAYFLPNMRSVSQKGVEAAMRLFMDAQEVEKDKTQEQRGAKGRRNRRRRGGTGQDDAVCEEALLEAFAK